MIQEERIWITSDDLKLEGLFQRGETPNKGAVLTHPHPAMGGTMYSNVVESLVEVFGHMGLSTLRFNFRGAGRSEGMYDEGRGEVNDLGGAISCLRDKGVEDIILSGYSFGAWIVSRYIQDEAGFAKVILVSPPVSIYSFDVEKLIGRISLIIHGDRDSYCRSDDARSFGETVKSQVVEIPRTDHFFAGRENLLIQAIQKYMDDQ
jgi:alpha/beta superfamily hydrolase